jgi:hypothetical protein
MQENNNHISNIKNKKNEELPNIFSEYNSCTYVVRITKIYFFNIIAVRR